MALHEKGQLAPKALLPLLRDLGDLKRVRSAGNKGSIAERLFADAWSRIAAGEDQIEVARITVLAALIASRLGDLTPVVLEAAGIPSDAAQQIWRQAAIETVGTLEPSLQDWLLKTLTTPAPPARSPPSFVGRLAAQPRAGATCPGRGRLVLEPSESHADHCLVVAVYGVLLASSWTAEPEIVFLAALAHHLHNALLPDAGFAGEEMLGVWLEPAVKRATMIAMTELEVEPRRRVEAARAVLPNADSPEGCSFHAADTLDRVLEVEHHLRVAGATMTYVLNELELVHAGEVKPFQDAVLSTMGLAA